MRLDTTLPRMYCREFVVRGTKGLYNQNNNMVFVDDPSFSHDTNRLTLPDGSVTEVLTESAGLHYFYDSAKQYEEKYLQRAKRLIDYAMAQ